MFSLPDATGKTVVSVENPGYYLYLKPLTPPSIRNNVRDVKEHFLVYSYFMDSSQQVSSLSLNLLGLCPLVAARAGEFKINTWIVIQLEMDKVVASI